MQQQHPLELLALLLEYPTREYPSHIAALLSDDSDLATSEARLELRKFAACMEPLSISEMEELYTRTFDINPVASLEIGWHLYGEQYERGAFLVKMRDRLAAQRIPEGTELPDHIASALRLCAAEDTESAAPFTSTYLLPAIRKIQEGLVEKENPYRHLVAALMSILKQEFSLLQGAEHHV